MEVQLIYYREYNLQDITRLGKKPGNIIDLKTMIDPEKYNTDNEACAKTN